MTDKPNLLALTPERQAYVVSLGRFPEQEAKEIAFQRGVLYLLEELEAVARTAATRAAATYSHIEGASFRDYARHFIRGAMYKALKHEARQNLVRRAGELASYFGYWQLHATEEDRLDPTHDDEDACRSKLTSYVSAKMVAMTVSLWLGTETLMEGSEINLDSRPFFEVMRATTGAFRPSDQTLLQCVYGGGMGLREAAEKVGIAYPTAKVRHRMLLGKLRSAFKKHRL